MQISNCCNVGGKLLIRNDRPSHIMVYTESYGTVVGTHYHKFCQHFQKGCGFRQYYGYSSEGSQSITFRDPDWEKHDYFVSSSETAFELCMLRKFDAELLLGQMSYSQKAEIYNYCNGYPVQPKKQAFNLRKGRKRLITIVQFSTTDTTVVSLVKRPAFELTLCMITSKCIIIHPSFCSLA